LFIYPLTLITRINTYTNDSLSHFRIPLKEALESKRPLTRSVLESRVSEVQSLLDDAVSRKAFAECAPLQSKLDALVRKRVDLPTIDELKEGVRLAEQHVSDMATRRDFAGAAEAQASLDKANERLEDALRSEGTDIGDKKSAGGNSRFQSRSDLETAISEVTSKINDAIAKKSFSKATKYQTELDELESLRSTLPSLQELQTELDDLKSEMDNAIKIKNFQKADSIQNDIDKLEAKLDEEKAKMSSTSGAQSDGKSLQFTNEKGESVVFVSRYELEAEVNRFKTIVQNAAKLKKFKEASHNQKYIDQLEEMKPLLPTAEELKSELLKAKADMEAAIQSKDFDKAEQLDKVVDDLEKKFALEQKNRVQQPSPTSTTQTPIAPRVVSTTVKTPYKTPVCGSNTVTKPYAAPKSAVKVPKNLSTSFTNSRPVSKLRPKAPMISQTDSTVLAVAQLLASKRGDAAIITDQSGGLAGIITDTDVTRRVVAKNLPASTTCVADVMTANPSCVSMSDPATDAMVTMVENRFRHLPVTDDSGAVVGVLDIAKCLNDAISKLEKSQEKGSNAAEEALKASLGGAGGAQAAALQQLLGPLLSQAFSGQSSPTLRSILAGKPSTIVSPSTTIQETGIMMADARKAALVVDNGQLVG